MTLTSLMRAAAALAWAAVLQVHAAEPEAVLKLEPYRKTIAVRASVGGVEGLFAFDTAAGFAQLQPEFAARTGCRQRQRVTGFHMTGTRLDAPFCEDLPVVLGGRVQARAATAGVFDIMRLFDAGAAPIDGLLGLDLFAGKQVTIDFPAMRLIVETPDSLRERVAGMTPLPTRIAREMQGRALAVSVGVPTREGLVWMEVDSGNGGTILVAKPFASLFGLDPEQKGPQPLSFDVAPGLHARTDMAFAPDMIIDGNLGMPFLRHAVVTFDLAAGKVWMSQPAR